MITACGISSLPARLIGQARQASDVHADAALAGSALPDAPAHLAAPGQHSADSLFVQSAARVADTTQPSGSGQPTEDAPPQSDRKPANTLAINQTVRDQSDDQINPAMFRQATCSSTASGSPARPTSSFRPTAPSTRRMREPTAFKAPGSRPPSRAYSPSTPECASQNTASFLFDPEETGGKGLSEALGIAGFTNLDVVRNPSWARTFTLAGTCSTRPSR